jgi:serine/threonine protein kinase
VLQTYVDYEIEPGSICARLSDKQAVRCDVVAVDDDAGIGGVGRPAHPVAVVSPPSPDIVQQDVVTVDHEARRGLAQTRAADAEEHVLDVRSSVRTRMRDASARPSLFKSCLQGCESGLGLDRKTVSIGVRWRSSSLRVSYVMDSREAVAPELPAELHPQGATSDGPMHPAIGESIQGFRVIGLAPDQGAESDLYLVLGPDNRKSVLKLYRSGMLPATVINDLDIRHPRIVSPLLSGTWNGRPYEITPFFEYGSLGRLIKRDGSLDLSTVELLLRQLIEGLTVLHRAGIQHRDLKPSNILIKSQNPLEIALTDFGSSALATLTLLTQVRTTLAYAAPETLTGLYSRASDYWSLGIILIEAITGQNPLQWYGPSKVVGYQIVQGKVPIPDSLPAHWQLLLKGLLQRDHYKRWDAARILRWLAENEHSMVAKGADWFRRVILLASATLIISFASVASVEVWNITQAKHETTTLASPRTVNPIEQASRPAEKQFFPSSLDLKTNPWIRIGLSAVVWLLAIGLVLAGFGHCISGTPHGFAFICGGLALAAFAFYLPQLLR